MIPTVRSMTKCPMPSDTASKKRIFTDLRVVNPKYISHVRFRKSRYGKAPKQYLELYYHDEHTDVITMPRNYGLLSGLRLCDVPSGHHEVGVPAIQTMSITGAYPEPKLPLYDYQDSAANAFFDLVNENDKSGLPTDAIIVLATSSGKTVLGMHIAFHSWEKALIVVPTQEVEEAWLSDCEKIFGIDPKEVGRIRSKEFRIGPHFTIGSVQTLMKLDPKLWSREFGITIFDEAHRYPGECFIKVLESSESHIRVGLTATDKRKDGMMPAIHMHLGSVVYKDTTPRNSVPLTFHQVVTDISVTPTKERGGEVEFEWNDALSKLLSDYRYNRLIIELFAETQKLGGCVLITSCRTEHIQELYDHFCSKYGSDWAEKNIAIVTGKTKKRKQLFQAIKAGQWLVTIATQSIMSEGASCPAWWHTIIASPFSDEKTMVQLKGRPIRLDPDDLNKKEGHVWDVVANISMFRNMGRTRYRAIKPHAKHAFFYNHDLDTNTIRRIK